MDISKLPKLSQTPASPEAAEDAPSESVPPPVESRSTATASAGTGAGTGAGTQAGTQAGTAADAWISIVLGVILLFMSPRILQYIAHRNHPEEFTKAWSFTGKDGLPLAYTSTAFFLCDLGLALFAVVLIVEGITLVFSRRARLVLFALVLTVATVIFNLLVLIKVNADVGFQLWPAMAVGFGGYIAMYQWNLYKSLK